MKVFMHLMLYIFATQTFIILRINAKTQEVCQQVDLRYDKLTVHCPLKLKNLNNTIYLLYDVNPVEGFNLRRDVYIRLAVFVRNLQKRKPFNNVRLVLPPWPRLYHWKSQNIMQDKLPWKQFFDIESLRRYAPILDFPEFLEEIKYFALPNAPQVHVQQTFQLQQFQYMFENGVFHEKYEFAKEDEQCKMHSVFLQQQPLLLDKITCVRYQGNVNLLERVLHTAFLNFNKIPRHAYGPYVFAVLNAEIVLHDHWGDREFWRARRSMRFAANLVAMADAYRWEKFEATNSLDKVQRPAMWEMEKRANNGAPAIGGNYLCAHLRRGDFIRGRAETTPTLRSAAMQIRQALQQLNLTTVFLATDADAFELKNLKSHLTRLRVMRFHAASLEEKAQLKDGGLAIIDQLVCAHARYFIGTYESTFTYRIYEEREILGFPREVTFNTFCKNDSYKDCSKNSIWPIVY